MLKYFEKNIPKDGLFCPTVGKMILLLLYQSLNMRLQRLVKTGKSYKHINMALMAPLLVTFLSYFWFNFLALTETQGVKMLCVRLFVTLQIRALKRSSSKQACRWASRKASRQASKKAGSKQTKQAGRQASKQLGKQTSMQATSEQTSILLAMLIQIIGCLQLWPDF